MTTHAAVAPPASTDSIEVDGRTRRYTVVGGAPAADAPASARPLVLVFHGSKQDGARFRAFTGRAFDALAADDGAVVAYLDGYRGNWNDARRGSRFPARREGIDDVAFAAAVIGRLSASHGVDPDRVFAVGYSNGGQMVMRLAHETPRRLAGAAVVAATMPVPEDFLLSGAQPPPMPVLLVHGTRDRIVAYGGGALAWWARRLFKVEGRSRSAPETAAYFAAANGLPLTPVTDVVTPDGARPAVERTSYRGDGRSPVVLYTVRGGGHTVPGPKRAPFVLGRTSTALDTAQVAGELFGIGPRG